MKMCDELWHGEEDGTALICDGTATLETASRQTGGIRERELVKAVVARAMIGARFLKQRYGNHTKRFCVTLEDLPRREPAPIHPEDFLWIEEDIPDAQIETKDESRQAKEGTE